MTTLNPHTPGAIVVPLGSTFGAWLFLGALKAIDAVRGTGHQCVQSDPLSTRIAEAGRLRRHAQGFMSADPRFAADLFAAADRHERME